MHQKPHAAVLFKSRIFFFFISRFHQHVYYPYYHNDKSQFHRIRLSFLITRGRAGIQNSDHKMVKMSVICYRRYNQEYIRSLCLYRFFQRFTCYIIQYAEDKMSLLQINLQVKYVIYSFFCVEVKLIKITVGFYKGQSKEGNQTIVLTCI